MSALETRIIRWIVGTTIAASTAFAIAKVVALALACQLDADVYIELTASAQPRKPM